MSQINRRFAWVTVRVGGILVFQIKMNKIPQTNRPFSKMAAENSIKSKLKTYTSTRKNTFTLVTLQSFSTSGVISAEKMLVENLKIYSRLYDWGFFFFFFLMTGGMHYTPSHTNVCKFLDFQPTFSQLIWNWPEMLKLCRLTKVKVLFLVLVCVFNFS